MPSNITRKLIQLLGKSIYDNRRKIRKKMLSSLSFLTYRDWSCLETLNKLPVPKTKNRKKPRTLELPPRTRRIPHFGGQHEILPGTTSAYAENTGSIVSNSPPCGNYLRMRGEYFTWSDRLVMRWELPPRARRIQTLEVRTAAVTGTTSACAENTGRNANHSPCPGNYLRVRGEYSTAVSRLEDLPELPPRARRIPHKAYGQTKAHGTTSACAENTPKAEAYDAVCRNYLRVRGEYLDTAQAMAKHVELPPRARRIHDVEPVRLRNQGTTSACAENTNRTAHLRRSQRNYLRVRGEYPILEDGMKFTPELPPRARRIPTKPRRGTDNHGTTSACAENTYTPPRL